MEIGIHLSSEEHSATDLIETAARAEQIGMSFGMISDHFHPWVDEQGHSPFVWATLGGLARATERMSFGTAVTCPTIRIHPAIVAHAAATVATMMPGRFFLGVGSGENLNEHIFADPWPAADERLEMLAEAIEVIRLLWQGGEHTHRGRFYTVEDARIYDLPDEPIPLMVAAWGERATEMAARLGDGLVSTSPDRELLERFERNGGEGKPRYGKATVCWAEREDDAVRTATKWWPNTALPGQLATELRTPKDFEAAAKLVTEDHVKEQVVCGNDPERHLEQLHRYRDAGYTHVAVHQVGPDQEGFLRFYEREVLPKV